MSKKTENRTQETDCLQFPVFRFLLFCFFLFTVLTACSPREQAFKSDVPVRNVIPRREATRNLTNNTQFNEVMGEIPRFARNDIEKINLPVPFFPQAPDADWNLPWQEACEEASVILAYFAATNKPLTKDQFRQEILNLVEWQNKTFGDYKHTNITQTAQILTDYYGFKNLEIIADPTVDWLKSHLAQGHLIIAPFAGRELPNPFYRQPGPLYHMMVLRGYDQKNFIVNDVGTRRGENFIYPYQTILSAMHEWHDEDIKLGAKKVIVLKSRN